MGGTKWWLGGWVGFTRRMMGDFFGWYVCQQCLNINMMPKFDLHRTTVGKETRESVVLTFPFSECYELILNHFLVLLKLEHRLADRFSERAALQLRTLCRVFFRNATGISDRVRQAPVSELLVLAARSLRTMVFLFPFLLVVSSFLGAWQNQRNLIAHCGIG